MRRSEFLDTSGCSVGMAVIPVEAQQGERKPHVDILDDSAETDPEVYLRIGLFRGTLRDLDRIENRNLPFDRRYRAMVSDVVHGYAKETIAKRPDAVSGAHGAIAAVSRKATRSVPSEFRNVSNPVAGGPIAVPVRPGDHFTRFTQLVLVSNVKSLEQREKIAPIAPA